MKPYEISSVKITNLEACYLYILLAKGIGREGYKLFERLQDAVLDAEQEKLDKIKERSWESLKNMDTFVPVILDTFFKPEESEQQKKIRELEETINKAQAQIEALKKETK